MSEGKFRVWRSGDDLLLTYDDDARPTKPAPSGCARSAPAARPPDMRPPYSVGDRIVRKHDPANAVTVTRIEPHPRGGWTIGYSEPEIRVEGITYDEEVVPMPEGWEDQPMRPVSYLDRIEFETDGPITASEYALARHLDNERAASRIAHYRATAAWWRKHGARIDPERAAHEAQGADYIASVIESEVGSFREAAE